VLRDGLPFDPIRDQGQGHETSKLGSPPFSKSVSVVHSVNWQTTTAT